MASSSRRKSKSIRKPIAKNGYSQTKSPYTDINGQWITEGKKMGYCYNKLHKGYLNHKLIIEHGCTAKNCPFFKKFEEHPFWVKKAKAKADKKRKKQEGN